MTREQVCSQYPHCLSCPLSISVTGKECYRLSEDEVNKIMSIVREFEATRTDFNLSDIFSYIRGEAKHAGDT